MRKRVVPEDVQDGIDVSVPLRGLDMRKLEGLINAN